MKKKQFKNKRLFQGMGIGYIICLVTHILAALLPMYVVFPFAEHLFGHSCGHSHSHGHGCGYEYYGHIYDHSHGLLNHILGDILILTMIIIPVALLTWLGHKLVRYFKCKGGCTHDEDPCETCPHRKY